MQDRFRFRVWKKYNCPSYDKHKPEMFYDAEKTYDFLLNNIPENCFSDILEDEKEYIVMQCTGLKDKNGKLIYEGDIVTPVHTNATLLEPKITGQVISGKACFQIQSPHIAYNALQILNSEKAFEVIGNIYENPELLESEE